MVDKAFLYITLVLAAGMTIGIIGIVIGEVLHIRKVWSISFFVYGVSTIMQLSLYVYNTLKWG